MKQKNQETDQLKIVANENIAIKKQVPEKVEKKTFTDFIYDVGPRFRAIKKRDVDNAISIAAFFDEKQLQSIVSLKSVNIIIIEGKKRTDTKTTGHSNRLTAAQLKLIQSFDYSTNFLIRAEYQQINKETGELEDSYSTPHLTIIPEKQAEYINGKDTLKKFLKENSKKSRTNVDAEELKPAKLYFTITKNGSIENVKLDRSSGYPLVDEKMIELINNTSGKWKPAENYKGEKIEQELVVSFGLMGC
ncbi:MAG: energy transducer TonB [Flavobacteriaceae bacterium]|nr:energy transducer TonB [Flavobacteriaceae bacterium]